MDYSNLYREQLSTAILESANLGFLRPALVTPDKHVTGDVLGSVSELVDRISGFLDQVLPGYWGNSCQTLSSNLFAYLNAVGIPANIVLGNVLVNGTDEFQATLEGLRQEFNETVPLRGDQHLHAWICLGDDTVVDAALPPRLAKHYNAPPGFDDLIFVGRADEMVARYRVQYIPLLVGTEFFAKTNPPDPMDLLNRLKESRF